MIESTSDLLHRHQERRVARRRHFRQEGRRRSRSGIHQVPEQREGVADKSGLDVGRLGEGGEDGGEAAELLEVQSRERVFDANGDWKTR